MNQPPDFAAAGRGPRRRSRALSLLTLALACGWAAREFAFARERAALVKSGTVPLDRVDLSDFKADNQLVGRAGAYFEGDTPASTRFITGRFVLEPGKSPHPPHRHPEEEVMIIESGHGQIVCDGQTTPIAAGSAMYTAPNVEHGIENTGTEPIVFYFIKWAVRGK